MEDCNSKMDIEDVDNSNLDEDKTIARKFLYIRIES